MDEEADEFSEEDLAVSDGCGRAAIPKEHGGEELDGPFRAEDEKAEQPSGA